ncbi:MAG: hypothetical protein ABR907_01140 [Terracidiphilus sp.]
MKAAELIGKEPFSELFTLTVKKFLTLRFGGNWKVVWTRASLKLGGQLWIVNLHINSIFYPGVSRRALENIEREFATSVIPWKRPLQRFYFWLATIGMPRMVAHAFVSIEPVFPDATQWLMIPGTHKIRFVNAANGIVYCHLKSGSSREHFLSEIESREFAARTGVPVPPILERLSNECVAEQMIIGTPLNRLTSRQDRAKGLLHALDAMEPLYRSTSRQVRVEMYVGGLISQISMIAQSCKEIAATDSEAIVRRIRDNGVLSDFAVETVRSHGDFQPGNILYGEGTIWLIDWEYSKERQRQYDWLTYFLRARFPRGLGKRIVAYAESIEETARMTELQLFLIESIVFELEAAAVVSRHSLEALTAILAEFKVALPSVLRVPKI